MEAPDRRAAVWPSPRPAPLADAASNSWASQSWASQSWASRHGPAGHGSRCGSCLRTRQTGSRSASAARLESTLRGPRRAVESTLIRGQGWRLRDREPGRGRGQGRLIKRGGEHKACSSTAQVKAQSRGAVGVIIVNNDGIRHGHVQSMAADPGQIRGHSCGDDLGSTKALERRSSERALRSLWASCPPRPSARPPRRIPARRRGRLRDAGGLEPVEGAPCGCGAGREERLCSGASWRVTGSVA